jgi:hypothetical protein
MSVNNQLIKAIEAKLRDSESDAPGCEALDMMLDNIVNAVQREIAGRSASNYQQVMLLSNLSRALAHILACTLLAGMPVGREDELIEKVEIAVTGIQEDLIEHTREMLRLNEIPDPWESKDVNAELRQELLRELDS